MRNQEGYLHSMAVTGISGDSVSLWDPRSGQRTTMSSDEFNALAARAMVERSAPKQEGLIEEIKEALSSPIQTLTELVDGLTEEGGGRLGGRGQQG
ncbi:hypothetical protein D3C87_1979450 [compost metagenome]